MPGPLRNPALLSALKQFSLRQVRLEDFQIDFSIKGGGVTAFMTRLSLTAMLS